MLKIAVTGLMCSGKSTICRIIEKEGINTASADSIVRELQAPGAVIYESIRNKWKGKYFEEDGKLNRELLGKDILKDSQLKKELEAISHPPVLMKIKGFLTKNKLAGAWGAAVEVPLLFEAGWEKYFDVSLLAEAPEEILLDRISQRKGIGIAEARSWLEMRPLKNKLHLMADIRIDTSESLAVTEKNVKNILESLRRNADEDK